MLKSFTHGGLPESEAQSWTPENQHKLGRIVTDLDKKETAYKAWGAYYELKRYFMPDVWAKFICDLTDFRKLNGFRGINEMLAEANPYIKPKECVMKDVRSEALSTIAQALRQLSEGIISLLGPDAVENSPEGTDSSGKTKKVKDGKPTDVKPTAFKALKEEKLAEPAAPVVDFVALRAECKAIVLDQVQVKGRDKVIGILGKFGAGTLPAIKDADLPALKAALEAEKTVEPDPVA